MNKSLASAIGISFGNWQLILNIVMLILVFIFNKKLIGFGTIFNMVLIGYYADFFTWLWAKIIPADAFTTPLSRWPIFLISLICFVISAAVYINTDMGVAPFDGLPIIITEKVTGHFPRFPKALIRICWDFAAIITGMIAGSTPIVGIILMAFFLGPAISAVRLLFDSKKLG